MTSTLKANLVALALAGITLGAIAKWPRVERRAPLPRVPSLPVSADAPLRVSLAGVVERQTLRLRFENTSSETIRLLRPLDGSLESWFMPFYRIIVLDANGNRARPYGRCGNSGVIYSNLAWPEEYFINILPHGAYEMLVGLPTEPLKPGAYTVSFRYEYDAVTAAALVANRTLHPVIYPEGLWEGVVETEPAVIVIP